nr:hypothetical protein [Tanacetum cinerariifolium]
MSPKWDAPEPVTILTVDVEGTSRGNADLFGQDKRSCPPGARAANKTKSKSSSGTARSQTGVFADAMQKEMRLKRESQQKKDRTVIKLKELRFLATRTDGLSPQDAAIIEMQNDLIWESKSNPNNFTSSCCSSPLIINLSKYYLMAASSVEYRQEEEEMLSSGDNKENHHHHISSLLLLDFHPRLHDSESGSPLMTEARLIIHGQDPGADDLINSENTTDYDWLLSPPRNPASSPEMEEQKSLMSLGLSNDQSTSQESRLENPPADTTLTANTTLKLSTSSNGVKSSSNTIRRPSPSRKAPSTVPRSATPTARPTLSSTTKPSRSSTPTSRATFAATKPVAPSKRSITPTSRPSLLPSASKSSSRSSTPTARPSIVAAAKSSSSSTPTSRPSIVAAVKSASRSSTPTTRPSIVAAAKSSSRSSTPTTRPSNPSGVLNTSMNGGRSSSAVKARAPSRGSSPSVKSRPSKNPPTEAVPTIHKSVPETNSKAAPKRASCSPSRGQVSNNGANNGAKTGITRSRGYSNGSEDVNPVLMGTKMVERVVNMRKLAPPKDDHVPNMNNTSGKLSVSQDNSGFGRSLSKKSFDMALRHLDIRRSMPGNMRAMITKVPASSVYSVRSESTKTQTISASDSPLATSSSTSSDHSENGHSTSTQLVLKVVLICLTKRIMYHGRLVFSDAKSRPNGKLIHNSILNGPYVRRMIPEPGDTNREIPVNETFHVQTDDELIEKELKQIEADDQAIQTILLGLPEDIYAAVDSCETAQEIWLRVQQMMKGSDIGIQEKKAKLFNE